MLVEPIFDPLRGEPEEVLALLKAIQLWSVARLTGALASERRDNIIRRLTESVYDSLLGETWARAEMNLRNGKVLFEKAVNSLLGCFEKEHRAFGHILARDARKYANMAVDVRAREFAILAQRYKVGQGALSRPAIDLGEIIAGRLRLPDADLLSIIRGVWDYPALPAGERLIRLLANREEAFNPLAQFEKEP